MDDLDTSNTWLKKKKMALCAAQLIPHCKLCRSNLWAWLSYVRAMWTGDRSYNIWHRLTFSCEVFLICSYIQIRHKAQRFPYPTSSVKLCLKAGWLLPLLLRILITSVLLFPLVRTFLTFCLSRSKQSSSIRIVVACSTSVDIVFDFSCYIK